VKFVWFSRYLLLAFIVAYVVLLLLGLVGSMTAFGLGTYVAIGIGLAAFLCVVSQLVFVLRRKRAAH